MEDLFENALIEQEPEEIYRKEPDKYNDRLFKKRDNLTKGNFNVIPYPYKRASYYFPGLEKPTYTVITAESKFGKTSFASAAFLLEPLWQAYTNPRLKLWYHYCNLEESEDRIKDRIVSWLLYKYTNGTIRIGYRDLNSATVPLPEEVSNVLESDDFKEIRDFFFSRIEFDDNSYPTGLEIGIKQFANKHGQILRGESFTTENNITGKKSTYKTVIGYQQNDEDEFLIVFADNLNNVSPESGQTLLQAITKVSKFFKDIRNKFNFIIIALQQLSADSDSNEAFKLQRYEPRITQLGDCKQVRRDVNSGIAIFSPTMKFEGLDPGDPRRHIYKGYNLDKFGDYFRTINFLIDRDGASSVTFPMYFDGKIDLWEELPLPSDTESLQGYYDRLEQIKIQEAEDKRYKDEYKRTNHHSVNFFMAIKKINNRITKSKVFRYLCNPFKINN